MIDKLKHLFAKGAVEERVAHDEQVTEERGKKFDKVVRDNKAIIKEIHSIERRAARRNGPG